MTSDVKIPEWAEKAAQDFHNKWETGMSIAAFLANLRRSIRKGKPRTNITLMVFRDDGTVPVRIEQGAL